jgi:hypothetical protein
MAKWIRLRTQVPLLIISFFLSSMYRTFVRVWPLGSSPGEVRASARGAKSGLIFQIGRQLDTGTRNDRGRQFVLELNSSFPFLHLQPLAAGLVPVAYAHTPCISQTEKVPQVNSMQFGFGVSPSGNEGVCSNADVGNQFSSNPPIPSPGVNIGEPSPSPGGPVIVIPVIPSDPGCGGCDCACATQSSFCAR